MVALGSVFCVYNLVVLLVLLPCARAARTDASAIVKAMASPEIRKVVRNHSARKVNHMQYEQEERMEDVVEDTRGASIESVFTQEHAGYEILVPRDTWAKVQRELRLMRIADGAEVEADAAEATEAISSTGGRLKYKMSFYGGIGQRLENDIHGQYVYMALLLQTKEPHNVEEVIGNGKDWSMNELGILGDVSFAVPVEIFDDGLRTSPHVHQEPFRGTLLYTCGASLPIDWDELVTEEEASEISKGEDKCCVPAQISEGSECESPWHQLSEKSPRCAKIKDDAFNRLYERRLLPAFRYALAKSRINNKKAFITIPGLGSGVSAGLFRKSKIGSKVATAIKEILKNHYSELQDHIQAVYYDAYDEGDVEDLKTETKTETATHAETETETVTETKSQNQIVSFGRIKYISRRYLNGGDDIPVRGQLSLPKEFERDVWGLDSSNWEFFSFVAWDHVLMPGNGYWEVDRETGDGARETDASAKAAASSAMHRITGVEGLYSKESNKYLPPGEYKSWKAVADDKGIRLNVYSNVFFSSDCGSVSGFQKVVWFKYNENDRSAKLVTVANEHKEGKYKGKYDLKGFDFIKSTVTPDQRITTYGCAVSLHEH